MFNVGLILLVVGGLGWLGYVVNKLRSGRLATTPFVKTGEAAARGAQLASAKGALSVEGRVECPALVTSPVTKTPCLYYELDVRAVWKQGEQKGGASLKSEKVAAKFGLNDGSGAVAIDASAGGADVDLTKSFSQSKTPGLRQDVLGSPLPFGEHGFTMQPVSSIGGVKIPSDAKFEVVEKCLLPAPSFYINGKVQPDGAIGSPAWTSMIVSKQSRDELARKAAVFATRSLAVGSVGTVAGAVVAVASRFAA